MQEIKVKAKFMLMPHKDGTIIVGGIFGKLLSTETKIPVSSDEMWVAELTIKPAYKFVNNKDEDWIGLNIEQKLATGWGDKENWKKELDT